MASLPLNAQFAADPDPALLEELAALVVSELNLDVTAADIAPEAPLYGEGLGLDSIDILELALVVACGLAYALLGHWLSTEAGRAALGPLAPYLAWFYYLQHVGMFLALGLWFGATLRPGREALVTRFARRSGEPLGPSGLAYTRRVTLAWTVFFAAVVGTSTLLFFLAPLEAWSVFANLLTLPLSVAMFGAEYAVRLRTHPELCHGGVMRSVRAFWEHRASHTPESR
jgi:uncharacterized membrane protein